MLKVFLSLMKLGSAQLMKLFWSLVLAAVIWIIRNKVELAIYFKCCSGDFRQKLSCLLPISSLFFKHEKI